MLPAMTSLAGVAAYRGLDEPAGSRCRRLNRTISNVQQQEIFQAQRQCTQHVTLSCAAATATELVFTPLLRARVCGLMHTLTKKSSCTLKGCGLFSVCNARNNLDRPAEEDEDRRCFQIGAWRNAGWIPPSSHWLSSRTHAPSDAPMLEIPSQAEITPCQPDQPVSPVPVPHSVAITDPKTSTLGLSWSRLEIDAKERDIFRATD
ncbi:hypothetical protein BaRGS_00028341 [Batillaria attramentaria]|uniref:Uncharacterized protein n=1 Tax=Batillaria attramentaria TaxID=370345 RepID=A0ABD0K0E7_9CAEN